MVKFEIVLITLIETLNDTSRSLMCKGLFQMVWFRENWYEEVLRQLRQALAKCYAVAFENRGAVTEATITPHTMNFVRKLVTTFGVGEYIG